MGLRSRLKGAIKQAIGREDNSYPEPPPPTIRPSNPAPAPAPAAEEPAAETPAAAEATAEAAPVPSSDRSSAARIKRKPRAGKLIFPEECPSCGAASYGNWAREDGQFVCGSCNAPYAQG